MSSSTATRALDIPVSGYPSEKTNTDGANIQLAVPAHTVARARSTTEGIEMDFLGRNRGTTGPRSLENDDGGSIVELEVSSRREWIAVAVCGLCLFLSGWQDGSLGPLIPTIQKHYNLTFTVVSVLFVSGCLGFVLAAILNIYLSDRLGFGRFMFIGGVFQAISYTILVPAFPFPVMIVAFATKGFGVGLQDALANGFVGAGALISPVVATQFAYHAHWSYHYIIPLAIASLNLIFLLCTFGFYTQGELLGPIQPDDTTETEGKERKYKQVFGSRAVHIMAIFCLLYVGAETTLGGWIVTFVVEERGGKFSAGYISSGFYGGLMLGRIGLIWLNRKVGERRVVYMYLLLAIGLEVAVWVLPNLIGNAVAFALIGVLMGQFRHPKPMYPISMNVLGVVVPKWLLTESMGWIASVGQAGGALFPFLTGTLIQKHGVHVLQPILVALLGGMLVSWALVPSNVKRRGD